MSKSLALKNVICVDKQLPPDGEYRGSWSGYKVRFQVTGGGTYEGDSTMGVRGIDVPCTVVVSKGKVKVKQ